MILYELTCSRQHGFEGWFSSSAEFDRQSDMGLIACPVCDDQSVTRAPMAPHIARHGRAHSVEPNSAATPASSQSATSSELAGLVREFVKSVETNCDYVGTEFPEEARKIHYGETDARGIYGEASKAEVVALKDEGIDIAPIPWIRKGDT